MCVDLADWTPDPNLTALVDERHRQAIAAYEQDRHLIEEHYRHEEQIRVGGYSNRTLLELVQNAADATSAGAGITEGDGRVEIVLDPGNGTLYCANNGMPFEAKGIIAICHAYLSGKKGEEIGRFGLGFKSVLAVSDTPQIISRSIGFEFNAESTRTELRNLDGAGEHLPILRTPTLLDASGIIHDDAVARELAGWASTIVRLPGIKNIDSLEREMDEFRSDFLLFVSAVREVRLRVIGGDGFDHRHTSRFLGEDRYRISGPAETPSDWLVGHRNFFPSRDARIEAGESVARERIKVSVAIPLSGANRRLGEFWAYFPLQDKTTATGLFNAPWSVNDDRTTLLEKKYNLEIAKELAKEFSRLVPRLSTPSDPSAHFDYLPARGRETRSYGDTILTEWIPRFCSETEVIPNVAGDLCRPDSLQPLEFAAQNEYKISESDHRDWETSPNTGMNVPHWSCYRNNQRTSRLQDLYLRSLGDFSLGGSGADLTCRLKELETRSIDHWLAEWAAGPDLRSSARCIVFAAAHSSSSRPATTRVRIVPTTIGRCSLSESDKAYLPDSVDAASSDRAFVRMGLLEFDGVEKALRSFGFRHRNAKTILREKLHDLENSDEFAGGKQEAFWSAASALRVPEVQSVLDSEIALSKWIRVPTLAGSWRRPPETVDLGFMTSAADYLDRALDREKCVPPVARRLGVVPGLVESYCYEFEWRRGEYEGWAKQDVGFRLESAGLGQPYELQLEKERHGTGPFSLLVEAESWGADENLLERWTSGLLDGRSRRWKCVDLNSGNAYDVDSPQMWAAKKFGRFKTSKGLLPFSSVGGFGLVWLDTILPVFKGVPAVASVLDFPNKLADLDEEILKAALSGEFLGEGLSMERMVDFVLEASSIVFGDSRPATIPARCVRIYEPAPTESVYVAISDEQESYLVEHELPYLRAEGDQAERLVTDVGCVRFSDVFQFSVFCEDEEDPEPILDVFPGLKHAGAGRVLRGVKLIKCRTIEKRVATPEGVVPEPVECVREESDIYVVSGLSERVMLSRVSDELGLELSEFEKSDVLQKGFEDRLELERQNACAAQNDADRLAIYIGEDDLKEQLPQGLWEALESLDISSSVSAAELFLRINGNDSLRVLRESFEKEGFDTPGQFSGSRSAVDWVTRMGFDAAYAGSRQKKEPEQFLVPGAVELPELHDYQRDLRDRLATELSMVTEEGKHWKGILVLPTGAGKTRVAVQTALECLIDGRVKGTVLWIAQSDELCEQAVGTFGEVWRGLGDPRPLAISRLWASNEVEPPEVDFSVVVATDAKLHSIIETDKAKSYEWLSDCASVFVDEAHVAGGSSRYTTILRWLGVDAWHWERPLIGLTATPFKGGSERVTSALAQRFGRNRLDAFSETDDVYAELVGRGVLARVVHQTLEGVHVSLDAKETGVAKQFGRVDEAVLNRVGRDNGRMRALVGHILGLPEEYKKSVLVFTPSVVSAQVLSAVLSYHGVSAASVSGQSSSRHRRRVVEEFRSGGIQVLVNCNVLTQGFDAPKVTALYVARPTFSPNSYIQMAGRGLRGPQNGGKKECLIVDVNDNFGDEEINALIGSKFYEDLWRKQS